MSILSSQRFWGCVSPYREASTKTPRVHAGRLLHERDFWAQRRAYDDALKVFCGRLLGAAPLKFFLAAGLDRLLNGWRGGCLLLGLLLYLLG